MRLGIVGHETAKFTPITEMGARCYIRDLFDMHKPELVVSGECHLGGVDIFAHEEADRSGIPFLPCPPKHLRWKPEGYLERNLKIVENSDLLVCIVVRELPPEYKGMRFDYCYHCKSSDHIKSGGCWTLKQAARQGKKTKLVIV